MESESDSDDDDDDDLDESDEDDDTGGAEEERYDVDICPTGCSLTLYNQVCKEREKRLDIEETVAELRRLRDVYTKDLDSLGKAAKVATGLAKVAAEDVETFQVSAISAFF